MGESIGRKNDMPVELLGDYSWCPRRFYFRLRDDGQQDVAEQSAVREQQVRWAAASGVPQSGEDNKKSLRTLVLKSALLGVSGRVNVEKSSDGELVPVLLRPEGRHSNQAAVDADRLVIAGQISLMTENGYPSSQGLIRYAGSAGALTVQLTEGLQARLVQVAEASRSTARLTVPPSPVEDSWRCQGCAYTGLCQPEDSLAAEFRSGLEGSGQLLDSSEDNHAEGRPLNAGSTMLTLPLYVQEQGARVGKRGGQLRVTSEGQVLTAVRIKDVSQVVLVGNVFISPQAVRVLCEVGIPVLYLSTGHWYYGLTQGISLRNAFDRAAQFKASEDPQKVLEFARAVVLGKGNNQRTLLRRNVRPRPEQVLREMSMHLDRVAIARSVDELRGLEGAIAALYFRNFARMLRPRDLEAGFDFASRNRRPPKDPVNALLSFGYAILARECTVALLGEGLDPWWGIYHKPRHGRPALALDLMEEFRPLVVDSVALSAINAGMVDRRSFELHPSGCTLTPEGRKDFLRAYERRMAQEVTHPLTGIRCNWRTVVRIQARILVRWLRGDVPSYWAARTR